MINDHEGNLDDGDYEDDYNEHRHHHQSDTYHHGLKENPAPPPLVHNPPSEKIGGNLNKSILSLFLIFVHVLKE